MPRLRWLCGFLLLAGNLYGQVDRGALTGTVRDSSGLGVSGASVAAAQKGAGLLPYESALYLPVALDPALKVPKLKPGDVVEGKLARDVYWGDRELFPAGSRVRMTVDGLGRRRKIPNDHWPWVVTLFAPRHEHYPTFRSAGILLPDGTERAIPVRMLSLRDEVSVTMHREAKAEKEAQTTGSSATPPAEPNTVSVAAPPQHKHSKETSRLMLRLEATEPASGPLKVRANEISAPQPPTGPVTLAGGTRAQIILLGTVSASKNRPGDVFRARVIEPVWLDSNIVVAEGTLIEGRVSKRTPPRMLSRGGSLQLTFTRLVPPGGDGVPVAASVAVAELDRRSHTRVDAEGDLRGDHPGKAWMLINLGVAAGTAKEADDATQVIIEAIVATATDASTAGVARIVGWCASGLFFVTRHGRDVVIPEFTEMTIMFDRPVSLSASQSWHPARGSEVDEAR
ncbi:MAG: hypothetical protein ACLQOO_02825 [Terriglobia bacterium]